MGQRSCNDANNVQLLQCWFLQEKFAKFCDAPLISLRGPAYFLLQSGDSASCWANSSTGHVNWQSPTILTNIFRIDRKYFSVDIPLPPVQRGDVVVLRVGRHPVRVDELDAGEPYRLDAVVDLGHGLVVLLGGDRDLQQTVFSLQSLYRADDVMKVVRSVELIGLKTWPIHRKAIT